MRLVSRRKGALRTRLGTTIVGFLLAVSMAFFGPSAAGAFSSIFNVLTFLWFWICLAQGVRQAAGSISDEKRDGTLGLLFLTALRPREIIAGKLFSIAIPLVQPLLAFLPVLSVGLLLGGTTMGEVLRAALVFWIVLVFSISAGLFVSSVSRGSGHTGRTTIILLFVAVIAPPLLARGPLQPVGWFSPWLANQTIPDPGYRVNAGDFWMSILVTTGMSLLLLAGASFFLPRRWMDEPVVEKAAKPRRRVATEAQRAQFLDRNPGEWLAMRHGMGPRERTAINLGLIAVGAVAVSLAGSGNRAQAPIALVPLFLGSLLLLLRLASQASHSLAEARRSGALEIVASSPLPHQRLISGQISALFRQFILPLSILLVAAAACAALAVPQMPLLEAFLLLAYFSFGLASAVASVSAIGMWMGLRENSSNSAFIRTVGYGLFLPGFFMGCAPVPLTFVVAAGIGASQVTGRQLRRLVLNEKTEKLAAAPPVIPPPLQPLPR